MLSPIKWIKPRLRSLCVAFGTADMTLVVLSSLCWYFVFDSAFEAQHIDDLYRAQTKQHMSDQYPNRKDDDENQLMKKFKEDRSTDELRLERTIRACGYAADEQNPTLKDEDSLTDANYAGPAALVGAAMGSFFTLGALLMSLNSVRRPAARRVICAVAIFGEGISCFVLFVGVAILSTNDGLCRTEYYYESFPPILYLFVLTVIFIFTYKTYEVTIIAFYLGEQATESRKEDKEINNARRSGGGRGSLSADIKMAQITAPSHSPKQIVDKGQGDAENHDSHKAQRHSHEKRNSGGTHGSGGTRGSGGARDSGDHRSQRRHFRQVNEGAQDDHHHHNHHHHHHHHHHNEESERRKVEQTHGKDAGHMQEGSEQQRKRHSKESSRGSKVTDQGAGGAGDGESSSRKKRDHLPQTKPKLQTDKQRETVPEDPIENMINVVT